VLKWGGGHSKKKEKQKKRQQFVGVSVKRDLLYGKRDLYCTSMAKETSSHQHKRQQFAAVSVKRDLLYCKRDLLYGKRDLLTLAYLNRGAGATNLSKIETSRSSRPWALARGRPQEAEEAEEE